MNLLDKFKQNYSVDEQSNIQFQLRHSRKRRELQILGNRAGPGAGGQPLSLTQINFPRGGGDGDGEDQEVQSPTPHFLRRRRLSVRSSVPLPLPPLLSSD